MPNSTTELLSCWNRKGLSKQMKKAWNTKKVVHMEREQQESSRCFEGQENSFLQIKLGCILLISFWCKQDRTSDSEILLRFLESFGQTHRVFFFIVIFWVNAELLQCWFFYINITIPFQKEQVYIIINVKCKYNLKKKYSQCSRSKSSWKLTLFCKNLKL